MADQGRWFKLWCSCASDPSLDNLSIADFGRWAKLGAIIKEQGTEGVLIVSDPSRLLCAALQLDGFQALISCVQTFPNVRVSSVTNATVSFRIEYCNWRKYQGDFSTERVHKHRAKKHQSETPKKRGEERRGEETRIQNQTPSESSEQQTTPAAPTPTNGLPDWFQLTLQNSPNFSTLLESKHAEFWHTMSHAFDAYEWLAWDEQVQKADAWIEANPGRRPKALRRFLLNWFNKAVDYGRIQHAKEERARETPRSQRSP